MSANEIHAPDDPRWGHLGRDKKAAAILHTVKQFADGDPTRGIWLDIGCGSGGVAATLAEYAHKVIGVDPESWQRWPQLCEQHPNLELCQGSYRDLQELVQPGSADVVICNQVYEHVDDPIALLAQIHRAMKPGGLCYFAGPNLLWPIEPHVFWPFVHWLPRRFATRLMAACNARYLSYFDAWSWPYWKLTRAFRNAGFHYQSAISERVRAQAALDHSFPLGVAARIPRAVVKILGPISPGFIFILTKPVANFA